MKDKDKFEAKNPEFVAEVVGLSVEHLDARLAALAKESYNVDESKAQDEDYIEAKEKAKEFGAPYRDAKKMIKLKSDYISELVSDKGGK